MSNEHESLVMKVLVLGDTATGKTSIIKRYVNNFFHGHHKPTVGVDFYLKQIVVRDTILRLQLWDIAGQDRFGQLARVYYKDALGAMLVYDVSRPATFESVVKWKEEIDSKVLLPNGQPLPVVLLGNKCDLETVEIDKNQVDRFCQEKGFIQFFDTSAKLNLNIDKAANCLVDRILQNKDIFQKKKQTENAFQPGLPSKAPKPSSCC